MWGLAPELSDVAATCEGCPLLWISPSRRAVYGRGPKRSELGRHPGCASGRSGAAVLRVGFRKAPCDRIVLSTKSLLGLPVVGLIRVQRLGLQAAFASLTGIAHRLQKDETCGINT